MVEKIYGDQPKDMADMLDKRIGFQNLFVDINSIERCPLNDPEICSINDGGVFGEYVQAQKEGRDQIYYADVKEVVDKCTRCRLFVDELKNMCE